MLVVVEGEDTHLGEEREGREGGGEEVRNGGFG